MVGIACARGDAVNSDPRRRPPAPPRAHPGHAGGRAQGFDVVNTCAAARAGKARCAARPSTRSSTPSPTWAWRRAAPTSACSTGGCIEALSGEWRRRRFLRGGGPPPRRAADRADLRRARPLRRVERLHAPPPVRAGRLRGPGGHDAPASSRIAGRMSALAVPAWSFTWSRWGPRRRRR